MNGLAAEAPISLAERWAAVRRRRWPALWVALGVLAVALLAALFWPPTYRSTGTILIEQQELPSELVPSTITSYADQRIQVISQRVMTTENLLGIIQRYDLYPRIRRREPREVLLERMREDVKFQMISADVMDPRQGRATKANIAFTVSYDGDSPQVAARVANELVSLYLDENVKTRRQLTEEAATFLNDEANKLSKTIEQQQQAIAEFKHQHINTLPDQSVVNTQLLTRTEEDLRDVDMQLRADDQQGTYLEAQLAQISPSSQVYTSTGERVLSPADRLKYLRTEYARVSSLYGPTHPDVVRAQREIAGLERAVGAVDSSNDTQRQLEDARTRLLAAEQRYAPDHPDVVRLRRQVEILTSAASEPQATVPPMANPDNPAYIQIKAQSEAAQTQRASLQQKRSELLTRLADLNTRLAMSPAVERDYSNLMREYEASELKFREVRQKQMAAKLAENLEDQNKGERFTLIDPPLVPEQPASPNRWFVSGFGLVLALSGGIGTVLVLENTDRRVRGRRDLESLLRVPPLAILPTILTMEDRAMRRRQRRQALAGVLGAFVLAVIMLHFFVQPLDVLWAVAVRKLGG
jgi:polysaccharide biosynthesis transport protein